VQKFGHLVYFDALIAHPIFMACLLGVFKKPGYLFLLGLLVACLSSTSLQAQQSNTYFIVQEISSALKESPLSAYKQRPLTLSLDAPDPVISLLQQSLIDQGFRLYASNQQDTLVLKVAISPNLTLSFSGKRKQKGQRVLQGLVVTTLTDHRDHLLGTYAIPIQINDPLLYKKEQFEDELWSIARFRENRKLANTWDTVLEPALIISAVTTSIYLLFNVRSR